MSHYDVDYSALGEAEKEAKALRDIKAFWGTANFNRIVRDFRASGQMPFGQFRTLCAFAGVQWYPVKALYRHCYGPATLPIEKEQDQ